METRSYGYTAQSKFGTLTYTYRPLIDVEVSSPTKKRTFKALVDSGTEITVMDVDIALLLNINTANQSKATLSGLESWREGFIAPVSLKIQGFDTVFMFKVLFVEDLKRNFDIILGQQDFFQNFDVTFQKSKNIFYLKSA